MSATIRISEIIPPTPAKSLIPTALYQQPDFQPEAPKVPLSHYVRILNRQRWKIVAFVAMCVLATAIISSRMQPIYQSTVTIDIDRQSPAEPPPPDSGRPSNAPNDPDLFFATQLRVIQSDAVLRPVAEQFHLLSREGQLNNLDPKRLQSILRGPVSLKSLKVSRPPNTYFLLISYRSPDPTLSADVANAIATSYLNHTYNLRIQSSASLSSFMERQTEELRAKMERSNLALAQFEKDLNVINPEEKTNILSSRLLQLNSDYTAAQGARVAKEADWNAIKNGSLEAAQVSSQGEALTRLNESLDQATQRFALVKTTFGPTHPEYRKAASEVQEVQRQIEKARQNISTRTEVEYREALNREEMLKKAVAESKAEWDKVNSQSFQYQRLKQEAEADKTLYDELIRKIREADINSGFQNNNIRIEDVARPAPNPVFPDVRLNLAFAFLASALFAITVALLHDLLDTTLRDPQEAGRFLGLEVIGSMPVDNLGAQLTRSISAGVTNALEKKPSKNGRRQGYHSDTSVFEEAIRTVRNTILLSDSEGQLRSIMITSSIPGEGKSTIAAHLAIANAERGKKTLLVDADLRRPTLHTKFGFAAREGLSNVLTGDLAWQDAVFTVAGTPGLSLLAAGLGSRRVADLIGPRLSSLLDEFAKEYDLVILDCPPVLGFAECLQMASAADGVLIVSKAGETKRKAVAEVISVLRRVRANMIGVLLNQVSRRTFSDDHYYGYSQYGKYQKSTEVTPS